MASCLSSPSLLHIAHPSPVALSIFGGRADANCNSRQTVLQRGVVHPRTRFLVGGQVTAIGGQRIWSASAIKGEGGEVGDSENDKDASDPGSTEFIVGDLAGGNFQNNFYSLDGERSSGNSSGGEGGALSWQKQEGNFGGNSWDEISLEAEVPYEQRPVNEYTSLKEDPFYASACLPTNEFLTRVISVWGFFGVFLGGPIAAASFPPDKEPTLFVLAASSGSLFVASFFLIRVYLGWSYVGNRLLSAVIPYEETGWYDGQTWVKPPEILARDRLLGSYQVRPILSRLRKTIAATAVIFTSSVLSLFLLLSQGPSAPSQKAFAFTYTSPSSDAKYTIRTNDLTSLPPSLLVEDDELANDAASAANGRPVYCTDRYYRALAGGQYCKWEDLRR